ncbi:phospholipase A-2-activating protein [Pluteus cervinus]|uniref:Phospholipase A-2-activating protein n=1 Tax=Pluteus cervinus TaxID=181527 RepID=A0ACD3BCY2_9AGAR|nr:phospholipase A-2-activating protein [Pluteus cervinus]
MPYKLSATLITHTADVRALSSPTNDLILSASRDSTAVAWNRSSSTSQFEAGSVIKASARYVNAIAYIPPTPETPKGFVVTGGQDTSINIFSLDSAKDEPIYTLLGHSENICALDVSPGGTIISGSWDSTAKVWKGFQLAHDLRGHQYSVWAVLIVDEDQYLTGSADKTIKLWQGQKLVQTFTGHQDAVRGLALMPDIGFASCSNDSEIRVWTLGGDVVYTLSGHTSFVYSLSVLPNGDIVSSGEDRSVRVWQDGECKQVIVHPAISVWAVSTLPNGDIVSGSSDGVVRVFSASEERWASAEDLKEYDEKVASQALPSQQVGDVKKSDLPGLEALTQPGSKPGEVKMIRNEGGLVEAYQWDATASTWQKIGEVVDAVGQGRKQLYQGKEYDYVFDVDIQDGVPPLKLPYNASDNPYTAAQNFLATNDLPATYIDEVVRFIEKNTSGVNIGAASEDYVDPFTGASRYRAAPATQAASSEYMDPFTGASRYRSTGTPQVPPAVAPSSNFGDPFTGASRYVAAGQAPVPAPPPPATSTRILPVVGALAFKQANVPAMQGKLFQFDDALRNEITTSSMAMYPDELTAVEETFTYLAAVASTGSQQPSTRLNATHIEPVIQILERWPVSQLFPVIDLGRLLVGFSSDAFDATRKYRFLSVLFAAAEWERSWELPVPKARETNILLVLRTLANSFLDDSAMADEAWGEEVLKGLSQAPYAALNKTQRVTLATILFNISCYNLRSPVSATFLEKLASHIFVILENEKADSEAVYRALVGLGNLAYAGKTKGARLGSAQSSKTKELLRALPTAFSSEERIQNVKKDILVLLA